MLKAFAKLLSLPCALVASLLAGPALADQPFQAAIAALPHVTHTKHNRAGDALNIGLIGTRDEVIAAMQAAGWFPADPVTMKTSLRISGSVVFHRAYADAPVSALYFQGRKQDLAFEKPVGHDARRRHHVRFWQVVDKGVDGRPAWLGAATFDRSVGLSHASVKITHHIAADVDAERALILADLAASQRLSATFVLPGAGPVKDARNGGGDHYFTDGTLPFAVITAGATAQTTPPLQESPP